MSDEGLFDEAVALHRGGRVAEAAAAYRELLRRHARHADLLSLLGQACVQLGDAPEAVRVLKKCLKLRPAFAPAHAHLGDAMNALGDHTGALLAFQRAIALMPTLAEAHAGRAYALLRLKRLEEALTSCAQALSLRPDFVEVLSLRGNVLFDLHRIEASIESFRQALAIAPDFVPVLNNLGNVLSSVAQHREAETCFRQALDLAPEFLQGRYNLGITLAALHRHAEAEACFRAVLARDPLHAPAWSRLGAALCSQGLLLEAERCCGQALALVPDYYDALLSLGDVLGELGRSGESKVLYTKAYLQQDPNSHQALSSLLFVAGYTADEPPEMFLARACEYGRRMAALRGALYSSWVADPQPQRLRLGWVSGDLREHPVGFFMESVLQHLDLARLELIAYPTVSTEDALTARVRPYFSQWTPIAGMTDEEAAQRMHNDGIHVLVDLAGHTAHNRLSLFAWKPAPVQVSWLGFFATTGLAEMDYLLADETGVPPGHRAHFSETVRTLPDTRLCYTPPVTEEAVSVLPALATGHVTFGCFQNMSKIGEGVLAAWARILAQLPGARLRLQAKQFADADLRERFLKRCVAQGIDAEAVEICNSMPRAEYLAAHHGVDMILDTFPYPGGTTTCDALWMGVPTLTLAGETLLARQGASLMTSAGLPDWVASSVDEYVRKAVAFAQAPAALADLRAGLRAQVLASPLFDAKRFAGHLGEALWGMWQETGVPRVIAPAR